MRWTRLQRPADLYITTITEAELLFGIALLAYGRKRLSLEASVRAFTNAMGDRVLPFDRSAAEAFAKIASARQRTGNRMSLADAQIAAISLSRGASLIATRDVGGFEGCGVPLVNPWIA